MKKSTIRWCIAALVLMLIGAIMAISAVRLGATTFVMWVDGEFKIGQETTTLEKSPIDAYQNIDIKLQSSGVELIPSDDYYIEFKECAGTLNYEVVDNTLVIGQKAESVFLKMGLGFANDRENIIKIYYPEDSIFDTVSIEVDMGSFYADEINVSKLDISCDMGHVEMNQCVAKEIIIDVDMGNVEIDEIMADKMETKVDKGNIQVAKIDLVEEGTIECDMGNVEMSFEKPVESYEIYAKIELGELLIDGEECGSTHRSEGEIPLELTNDMGNIELNFAH